MNYLIDSYAPYFVDGGFFGKVGEGINWLFVDMPFFILRIFSIGILLIQELLDQSDLFTSRQQDAYNLSMNILNNLGGKHIARGSILALLFVLSAYYLLYNFFVTKKNFSKLLIHYFAVLLLFVFWFGSIATPGGTKSGGTFLVESVSNIATGIKNNFTSASSDFSVISSDQSLDETPLFNATIKQTFYYVNAGSLDGTMENGEKIDEKKLLMPNNLSKEDRKEFEKERKAYLQSIEDDNPYIVPDMSKTMEKLMAIFTGGINLMVTSYPALYVNAMLSVVQIIVTMLIIVAPIFFVLSFFPACQSMIFKFFKLLIGVLFFPVVLGVFLAVFFWANSVIDTVYMNAMKLVAQPLLTIMSSGIFILTSNFVLIIVKLFLYKSIWKNKYRLLSYFTNNQVEQPEVMQNIDQKVEEAKERGKDITVGGAEIAAGAYTGNQALIEDGLNRAMPKRDKAMELGKEHFVDDEINPAFDDESGQWADIEDDNEMEETDVVNIDDVEFTELEGEDENVIDPDYLLDDEEIDHSLTEDNGDMMFDELSGEGLEEDNVVTVDNLDEIMLESEDEVERTIMENVEKETFSEEYNQEKEFSEEAFFGETLKEEILDREIVDKEINEED